MKCRSDNENRFPARSNKRKGLSRRLEDGNKRSEEVGSLQTEVSLNAAAQLDE